MLKCAHRDSERNPNAAKAPPMYNFIPGANFTPMNAEEFAIAMITTVPLPQR